MGKYEGSSIYVSVFLDFAAKLPRQCVNNTLADPVASDFELVTFVDREKDTCVFGHTTKYYRRKQDRVAMSGNRMITRYQCLRRHANARLKISSARRASIETPTTPVSRCQDLLAVGKNVDQTGNNTCRIHIVRLDYPHAREAKIWKPTRNGDCVDQRQRPTLQCQRYYLYFCRWVFYVSLLSECTRDINWDHC